MQNTHRAYKKDKNVDDLNTKVFTVETISFKIQDILFELKICQIIKHKPDFVCIEWGESSKQLFVRSNVIGVVKTGPSSCLKNI